MDQETLFAMASNLSLNHLRAGNQNVADTHLPGTSDDCSFAEASRHQITKTQTSSVVLPISTKDHITGEDPTLKVKENAEYWYAKYNEKDKALKETKAEALMLSNEIVLIEKQLECIDPIPAFGTPPDASRGSKCFAKIGEIAASLNSLRTQKERAEGYIRLHIQRQAPNDKPYPKSESQQATEGNGTPPEEIAALHDEIASLTKTADKFASDLSDAYEDVAEARNVAMIFEKDLRLTKAQNAGLARARGTLLFHIDGLNKSNQTLNKDVKTLSDTKTSALSHLVKVTTQGLTDSRKREEAETSLKAARKRIDLLVKEKIASEAVKGETVKRVTLLENEKIAAKAAIMEVGKQITLLETEKSEADSEVVRLRKERDIARTDLVVAISQRDRALNTSAVHLVQQEQALSELADAHAEVDKLTTRLEKAKLREDEDWERV